MGARRRLSGPNGSVEFLSPESSRSVSRSDSRANNARKDGPKRGPIHSSSGGPWASCSAPVNRAQPPPVQLANCCVRENCWARWSHCAMPRFRVVNGVRPRGSLLHRRTVSTSSESHPHDKCSTSRRCPPRRASKSSVGLLPDQLQVQMEASKWFPYAIFSVHNRGFGCSIKSRNLEICTLQERSSKLEASASQHPGTT